MKQKRKPIGPAVGLSISKHIALLDISDLKEFHLQIESKFKRDIAQMSAKYEAQIKELNASQKKELAEFLGGETLAVKTYMSIHRKNIIVSLCSFIETKLNGVCRSLHKKNNLPEKHTDSRRDKGITRARKYIKNHTKIDFIKFNSEWTKLNDLFKIRDCLIHCGGDIKLLEENKENNKIRILKDIVRSSKWLSIKGERHLELEKKFVDEALEIASTFIEKLYEEYFQCNIVQGNQKM
ncbi:hypothetical protein [uncultured Desulfobacter sp.]|uniref:hypothetical protein n=1 Tax=uncultured Desulfobacter sp. TaxID=240139 RepID=UPI0029C9B0BA|nr:hypothetical protein [uncultured Desulfobacter sp.]